MRPPIHSLAGLSAETAEFLVTSVLPQSTTTIGVLDSKASLFSHHVLTYGIFLQQRGTKRRAALSPGGESMMGLMMTPILTNLPLQLIHRIQLVRPFTVLPLTLSRHALILLTLPLRMDRLCTCGSQHRVNIWLNVNSPEKLSVQNRWR